MTINKTTFLHFHDFKFCLAFFLHWVIEMTGLLLLYEYFSTLQDKLLSVYTENNKTSKTRVLIQISLFFFVLYIILNRIHFENYWS